MNSSDMLNYANETFLVYNPKEPPYNDGAGVDPLGDGSNMEKLYIDKSNGEYQGFVYADGQRVLVKSAYTIAPIYAYAKKHGYKVVEIFGGEQ